MKQFIKSFTVIFILFFTTELFAQNHTPYPAFQAFYYASYDNLSKTEKDYKPLFEQAVLEAEKLTDPFEKNLRLAWAYYIMSNVWWNLENPTKVEIICDQALEYAKTAKSIKENEESLLIYINAIGQDCMVKPLPWLMKYGLEVNPIAKKIVKMNPKNGRAVFLIDSQDIYAPAPFNNYKKGAEAMKAVLADKSLQMAPQVLFDTLLAEACALINLDKKNEARSFLEQASLLFPNNKSLIELQKLLD